MGFGPQDGHDHLHAGSDDIRPDRQRVEGDRSLNPLDRGTAIVPMARMGARGRRHAEAGDREDHRHQPEREAPV